MNNVRFHLLNCAFLIAVAAPACLSSDPSGPDSQSSPTSDSGMAQWLDAANDGPPDAVSCIKLEPGTLAFGGVLVGESADRTFEISSCGGLPLSISAIGLSPDTPDSFFIQQVPAHDASGGRNLLGSEDDPIILQPDETVAITVMYRPGVISPLGPEGRPVVDAGRLLIQSSAGSQADSLELSGFGVQCDCPTATIAVQEGEEVIPQTVLRLVGSRSWSPTGEIAAFTWTVQQPVGSRSRFMPSASTADPSFEVNVAGRYEFQLIVTDSSGTVSNLANYIVFVIPDEAIHVELLWDTPNDPDQYDDISGADLDLHFVHPLAVGGFDGDHDGEPDGWFDLPFDCFWNNEQPNWGAIDLSVDDNPSLDRDDTDGSGPENLNLALPEMGMTYKIGVHYWHDHDFGTSFATVRAYIFGELEFEVSGVRLEDSDMWTVAKISWPLEESPSLIHVCAGTSDTCGSDADCGGNACGLHIVPQYHHPQFFQPD